MSGKTLLRAATVSIALVLSGCATSPRPLTSQSLLESMSTVPPATIASCRAANMALVCESAVAGRVRSSLEGRCSCADRNELTVGGAR
jgi:starvation-inducible outer membrane lipoprotein